MIWEAGTIEELGIGEGPYRVYRSGRHKNDMPGVFTLGGRDESLEDVLGAMTENGDKTNAGDNLYRVISDHLTIVQGSERSIVVEYMGGRKQLCETTIILDEQYGLKKIEAKVEFNHYLSPNGQLESEGWRVVHTTDVSEEIKHFAVDKAVKYGTRCGKIPSVFCTLYYYGLTVSYEDVKTNLNIMKAKKLPFDVFQVDEGWEVTLGEWEPNGKFPIPMKQVAEEIEAAGYRPGIWTSPFVAHETASIWKEHPEWRLNDKAGNPCLFPMNDTVYYVLDITNPATYVYFTEWYRKLTFDWGYTYHKLDFTRAAVIYEDADFYGKTAPYTIKQSVMRYYMNYWWDNDQDALMIRKNETMERGLRLTYGLLNDEEVKTSVINQFMGGGIMCTTEPLDKISEDRLLEYRRILPVLPREVKAINLMSGSRFPEMVDIFVENMQVHYICVITMAGSIRWM